MADRTVTVKLEADISDFVGDIGGKAVAAVKRLEVAASKANYRLKQTTADVSSNVQQIGSKADAASDKITRLGAITQAANSKISATASKASKSVDDVTASTDKATKATSDNSAATKIAAKDIDAHANAVGRLRTAQLRLTEVQNQSKPTASGLAGAEESVAAAERAVKKFEKAGNDSGKSFGAGLKKWFTGGGTNIFQELGKNSGRGFIGALTGALKTPVIGPILLAALAAAVAVAAPAAGAVAGAGLVAGMGAGIAGLGLIFAAQSDAVGAKWSKTMSGLGEDMKLLSKPFESTLISVAGFFQRTVDKFNPALAAAFSGMAGPITTFVDQASSALEELIPAIAPITAAFNAVLGALGPAMQDAIHSIAQGLIDLSDSVAKNPAALADTVKGLGDLVNQGLGVIRMLNDINSGFSTLTGGGSLVTGTFKAIGFVISSIMAPFAALNGAISATNILLGKTNKDSDTAGSSMSSAANKTALLAAGLGQTGDAAQHAGPHILTLDEQIQKTAKDAADVKAKFEGWITAMFRLQNMALGLAGAQINFQQAIDDASKSVKDNGRTLDINTEKGRANKSALDQIAQSANGQTEAMLRSGKGVRAAAANAESSRDSFVTLAQKMGLGKAQAEALARSLIAVPQKTQTDFKADITDLDKKIRDAKAKLADPKLSATKKAKLQAEIAQLLAAKAQAQAAIDSLSGKTVSITLNTYKNMVETTMHVDKGVRLPQANGGFWPKGIPSYADGKLPGQAMVAPGKGSGLVQWAEQETGGEAFIPLAPSKRDQSTKILGQVASQFGLGLVKSFAAGGFNLPGGRLVSPESLLAQLGTPFNPLAGVNYSGTLSTQTSTLKQFNAALATLNKARTAGNPKALAAAWTDYQKKLDAARKATDAHTASVEALTQQQKDALALADQIAGKQLSGAGIVDLFGGSLTAKGLLGDLQGQGQQSAAFAKQLASLRKLGLSQGLLQQLADAGSESGGEVAQSILDAGKGMVDALNKAQTNLEKQANIIGSGVATDLYGKTVTGKRAGGGSVMAGRTYQVNERGQEFFTAPVNGQIVPAGVDPRRYINSSSGWGGGSATATVEHHYHQANTFNGVDLNSADIIAQRATAKQQLMRRY